jgi:hypothetical protein
MLAAAARVSSYKFNLKELRGFLLVISVWMDIIHETILDLTTI